MCGRDVFEYVRWQMGLRYPHTAALPKMVILVASLVSSVITSMVYQCTAKDETYVCEDFHVL